MVGRHAQIAIAPTVGVLLGIQTPETTGAAMTWARAIGAGVWTRVRLPLVVAAWRAG
jgi:hypothetical protein